MRVVACSLTRRLGGAFPASAQRDEARDDRAPTGNEKAMILTHIATLEPNRVQGCRNTYRKGSSAEQNRDRVSGCARDRKQSVYSVGRKPSRIDQNARSPSVTPHTHNAKA